MVKVVGVDFGTTTTLVAERSDARPSRLIPIGKAADPWMPSIVGVATTGDFVVGEDAYDKVEPERIKSSVKAAITGNEPYVLVSGAEVAVADLAQAIIHEAVQRAERAAHGLFDDAIVKLGCPTLWTLDQRQILVAAAHQAGLECDIGDVIDEPVAAGLAWSDRRWRSGEQHPSGLALIFDAGGGTLDIAILRITGDSTPDITVLGADGIAQSGDAIDRCIFRDLENLIASIFDDSASATLLLRCHALKEGLSIVEALTQEMGFPYDVSLPYTRKKLDRHLENWFADFLPVIESTTRSREIRELNAPPLTEIRQRVWSDVSSNVGYVAAVGGMSKTPAVRNYLMQMFPSAEVEVDPRAVESVANGLAHGEDVIRLNLPRPPFNICLDFATLSGQPLPGGLADWALAHRIIYQAYSPLYPSEDVWLRSHLYYRRELPIPPDYRDTFIIRMSCEAPDRKRTRVGFLFEDGHVEDHLQVSIAPRRINRHAPFFRLTTAGELLFTGTEERSTVVRVKNWARIEGPGGRPVVQAVKVEWDAPAMEPHRE